MKIRWLAILLGTTLATGAWAQDEMGGEMGGEMGDMEAHGGTMMALGADFALVVPLSDFGDVAGIGIGALPKLSYSATEEMDITARVGYIFHLTKDIAGVDSKFAQIPFLVGLKYFFGEVYGALEFGIVNARVKLESQGFEVSDSETNPALSLGGGYMMGDLDLRLGLHMFDLGNAGESMSLMVNIGYDFMHF